MVCKAGEREDSARVMALRARCFSAVPVWFSSWRAWRSAMILRAFCRRGAEVEMTKDFCLPRWLYPSSLACVALLGTTWPGPALNVRAAPAASVSVGITLRVDGRERHALLHLPNSETDPARAAQALLLVIMLHGYGGTSAHSERETRWSAKADTERFVVAYPDATRPRPEQAASLRGNPQAWNDGSERFHAPGSEVNDVEFIRTLIDELVKQQRIDPRRIYVTGFSNGASMALRVGAELAERVTAVAPVAGASWLDNPWPARGISVLYLTGTADPLNPLQGGVPRLRRPSAPPGTGGAAGPEGKPKKSLDALMAQWSQALRCSAEPSTDVTNNGVRTRRYGGCRDEAEVAFVTIEGLGHIWAGGVNHLPEMWVGQATDKFDATDVIWNFFREKSLP